MQAGPQHAWKCGGCRNDGTLLNDDVSIFLQKNVSMPWGYMHRNINSMLNMVKH